MITVAIVGIIFTIAPQFFIYATRFFNMNRARIEIQRDARTTLNLINRNLRQAQASTIEIDNASGQPPFSRITFTRLTPDGTSEVSFYQQNKEIYQVVDSGRPHKLAENLRYLAFTFPKSDDLTLISIATTFERATYEGGTKALHVAVEKVRVMNE